MKGPWSGLPAWQTLLFAATLTAIVGFHVFTFRVNPDEVGIVLRFGKPVRQRAAWLALPFALSDRRGASAENHALEYR